MEKTPKLNCCKNYAQLPSIIVILFERYSLSSEQLSKQALIKCSGTCFLEDWVCKNRFKSLLLEKGEQSP